MADHQNKQWRLACCGARLPINGRSCDQSCSVPPLLAATCCSAWTAHLLAHVKSVVPIAIVHFSMYHIYVWDLGAAAAACMVDIELLFPPCVCGDACVRREVLRAAYSRVGNMHADCAHLPCDAPDICAVTWPFVWLATSFQSLLHTVWDGGVFLYAHMGCFS